MPLDDREQRILEEIERQFYADDPKLAETVRDARIASASAGRARWAALGLLAGLGLMVGFFTRVTLVALLGFGIMVLSAATLVSIAKHRATVGTAPPGSLVGRMRRRWRGR
jgi:uncharacterized membrane-anchored protein